MFGVGITLASQTSHNSCPVTYFKYHEYISLCRRPIALFYLYVVWMSLYLFGDDVDMWLVLDILLPGVWAFDPCEMCITPKLCDKK